VAATSPQLHHEEHEVHEGSGGAPPFVFFVTFVVKLLADLVPKNRRTFGVLGTLWFACRARDVATP
jgi:hypothetical protein